MSIRTSGKDAAPAKAGPERLRGFFAGYGTIALVANSEAVDIAALTEALPQDTLFVFFTRCARILSEPFTRPAVLCHRLKRDGSHNEGPKHVAAARSRFGEGALRGEIGLYAGPIGEADGGLAAGPADGEGLGLLDITALFADFYTDGMTPTTGFALSVWLEAQDLPGRIVLCGFSGVRGARFRMRTMHDWTLEQTALRMLEYRGRLSFLEHPGGRDVPLLRMRNHFSDIPPEVSAFVAVDVLTDRLTGLDLLLSRLWRVTRPQRRIHEFLAGLGGGRKKGRDGTR